MLNWTSGANLLGLDLYLWSATTSTSKGECIEEYSVYYTYLLKRLLECFQLPIVKWLQLELFISKSSNQVSAQWI